MVFSKYLFNLFLNKEICLAAAGRVKMFNKYGSTNFKGALE